MDAPRTLDGHIFYGMTLDSDQKNLRDAIWNPEKLIVFCDSPAGTGKTTIAVATALLLVEYGFYEGISFIVSPCNEGELGFLPGGLAQKTDVYSTPLYQALIECGVQPEKAVVMDGVASVKEGAYIEFMPHTYLRGSNLKNKIVIIEEAQNANFLAMKKIITRIHDTSKTILIGHNGQRDAHTSGESAFSRYVKHFEGDPRTAVCTLTKNYRGWVANHADALT